CDISQEDPGATGNDCLAAKPGHSISDKATVYLSDVTANTDRTVSDVANVPDPVNLDAWPGAGDLASS
nr:hypothetical protein [Tanacetum cinerariifolium]